MWIAAAILILSLALSWTVRARLLDVPLERDEGEYAYAGRLILRGVAPYAESDNMKLPGTYYAYAAIMAALGESPRGIRLGLAVWATLSALAVFAIGRRFLSLPAAAAAGGLFAVLAASPSVLGFFGHATHFAVLPALIGVALLTATRTPSRARCAAAGLLCGVAFLMKQQAAPFLVLAVALAAWRTRRGRAVAGAAAALGGALPYAILCAAMALLGHFETFWFWTVTYAREYVTQVPMDRVLPNLLRHGAAAVGWNAPIWALAAVGLAVPADRRDEGDRPLLLGLALAGFASTIPGFFFREHYFIPMLPAVALAAARSFDWIAARFSPRASWGPAAVVVAATAAATLVPAIGQRDVWFRLGPDEVSRRLYFNNPFPESPEIARYLGERSSPDDRVAVLGSEPQILFLADRRSALRPIYMYALTEPHPYALRLQEETIREVEAALPRFIVVVRVGTSWMFRSASPRRILEWMDAWIPPRYEQVGIVDIFGDQPTVYRWDEAARGRSHDARDFIVVLRRRGS